MKYVTRHSPLVTRISSLVTAALALAFLAANANADRTVAVTSLSGGNATLNFGATDGNAYTLAWGYGDEDGGSTTNAWDTFVPLGTVAAADTTRTVALPAGWGNTVTHLRFFLLALETRPYATRLEYIESTGTQWIDSGVNGETGLKFRADLTWDTSHTGSNANADWMLVGARKNTSTDTRIVPIYIEQTVCFGYGKFARTTTAYTLGVRHEIVADFTDPSATTFLYRDGTPINTYKDSRTPSTGSTINAERNLYIFAANWGGTANLFAKAKLYGLQIWHKNANTGDLDPVRDFVPCKDGNDEACLYDLVSGSYFRNSGSGTFTAGATVPPAILVAAVSALCEPVSRSIAIVSKSASAVTLAIGNASGNETYNLYMAYGATDGGAVPGGWDEFDELGEIDAGDNEYVAAFPAGWGTTVKNLRFFLLRPDDSVASRTETLIYVNELIIEAEHPTSSSANAEYDVVRLRDTLRLAGGTLTAPIVVVDGPSGNLDIDGGALSSTARLSLDPALETENEYATLLNLRTGTTTLQCATNANPDVAARIHFLGGSLKGTSFSGTPLCSANGGKWILEGTPVYPIRFGDLSLQRMSWLTGDGSVETRGYCDVIFDDNNYNAENDWRGTIWLNVSNTVWNHTGNLVLSNAVDVICRADDCLPSGPQTGGIVMKWVNRNWPPPPRLNLNGHSVAVNGIDATRGGGVTNSSSTVATLRIGEGDTRGSITGLVLGKGNINLVKRGAATNVVALGSSSIAALRVEQGTLVVTGVTADTLQAASVTVAAGATLIIEGTTVLAATIACEGAIERIDGGILGVSVGSGGTADSVVWDDPAFAADALFAKIGSNRAIVQTDAAINADIDVRDGTMVFSGRTCTNEWYRFLFNGSQYQQSIQVAIGDLRVYSDTNKTENVAKGIGSGGKILAAGSDPANLEPGACVAHFATASQSQLPSGQSANLWDLRNAFDDDNYGAVLSSGSYYIYNNASQTWVAFRMAAGKNRVQCYLPAKASGITWYWHPSAWLFQTSVDGINWQTVDTQTGALSSSGYGSTPFVIKGFLADGAAGFASNVNVKVAAGATLDALGVAGGQTLSRLTVDMTTGAGTIRGVTIARNGVLNLVNVPAGMSLHDVTIPVTLLDIANGANFSTWTILVNGAPARTGNPKWNGETLRLFDGATIITIW